MDIEQKILLKKFLNGNCTDRELREVKVLLNDPDAKEFLRELMGEQAEQVEQDFPDTGDNLDLTTEHWLKQVQERISPGEHAPEIHVMQPKRKRNPLRYAAVWTGLLLVSSVAFWQIKKAISHGEQIAYIEKTNTRGIPVKYILPDNSEVFLGAGSKLKYPHDFKSDKREITLEGEAFFQVKHMTTNPFIIHTGEIQTQVLGTSFKVQAFKDQPLTVAVATGKVGVSRLGNDQSKTLALLTPGLKVTWYAETGQAVQGVVDIDGLNQWKNGDIVFDESPLGQVTSELERRYGIRITFEDAKMAAYKVSGSFSPDESTDTVMKMLSIIGKFNYKTADNKSFTIDQNQ